MEMKYSIVIPVYNVEEYLPKCVDSVLQQDTRSNFEIILVDDGSPDGSGAICDAYAASDSRVQVIHQENKWISGARNTGMAAAKGEYILYLDSDDYYEQDLLSSLDELLADSPDIALFRYFRVDEEGKKPCAPFMLPDNETGVEYIRRLFENDAIPLPFVWAGAYRREFLLEHQLSFKETIRAAEDYDYVMRVLPSAERIVGTERCLYNYVVREGSFTSSLSLRKAKDNVMIKTETFRRYPTAAVANDYAWYVLMASRAKGQLWKELLVLIKENRDILSYVSQGTLKIAVVLIRLLGFPLGTKCFWILADMKKHG